MAPERIDPPDPTKPDYDVRADVWSLGISLVSQMIAKHFIRSVCGQSTGLMNLNDTERVSVTAVSAIGEVFNKEKKRKNGTFS